MTDELLKSVATGGPIAILFALFLGVLSRWILPIIEKFLTAAARMTDLAEQCVLALERNTELLARLVDDE